MPRILRYRFKCVDKATYLLIKQYLIETTLPRLVFWDIFDHERIIHVYELWPLEHINTLTSRFHMSIGDTDLWLKQKIERSVNEHNLFEFMTFKGDWEKHFKLLSSEVYYSGVMPCVRKIDYEINPLLQGRIQYLIFHVIRTTFATVDTFDNAQIMSHPFFHGEHGKHHLESINAFDQAEDALQEMHLYREEVDEDSYEETSIRNLNAYLKHSLNTHTIAILVNLITSDDYLIAAKRGNLSIDAGEYYCSANGQTEFRDEQVEFYRKSVFEDMPTMDFQSKYRIDLTLEAQRECIAELGTAAFDLNWNTYGVSYLSIHRKDKHVHSPYRRMHFNVMVFNALKNTFEEVDRNHKHATERFENESLVGFKINVYHSFFDVIKKVFLNVYMWLNTNKSRIFLFLIIVSILIGKRNMMSLDLSTGYDVFIVTVYLLLSLSKIIRNWKIRKRMITKRYHLWLKKQDDKLSLRTALKGVLKKEKAHAIFSLMYGLYFLSIAQQNE